MLGFSVNQFAVNVPLSGSSITTATTTGAIDLKNALGPILVTQSIAAGGSGTLVPTVTMSADDSTYVAVPSTALLSATTGKAATLSNLLSTSVAAAPVSFALKRDELMRYVKITYTPTPTATMTVSVAEFHALAYTSQSV
jgi:hypothetical protein